MPYAVEEDGCGNVTFTPGLSMGTLPLPRMYVEDLEVGDILVWYSNPGRQDPGVEFKHRIIRDLGRGAHSHVGVYVGNGESIDAGPKGVFSNPVRGLARAFEIATVLRLPDEPTRATRIQAAVEYLKNVVEEGRRYAWLDTALLPIRRWATVPAPDRRHAIRNMVGRVLIWWRNKDRYGRTYCSQLVVEAYARARVFQDHHIASAVITPETFLLVENFEHVGFVSAKEHPARHQLDIHQTNTGVRSYTWKEWRRSNRS